MPTIALSLETLEAYDPHPTERGQERRYCCPLDSAACHGKTVSRPHQSLTVNIGTGVWQCWRCHQSGKLTEFWEDRPKPNPKERAQRSLRSAFEPRPPAAATRDANPADGWRNKLRLILQPLEGTPGEGYLEGRGIPLALARAAKVKYCPRWEHWNRKGEQWELVGASRRVVFPVYGPNGRELVGVQARSISAADDFDTSKLSRGEIKAGAFVTPGAWEADVRALVEAPIDALTLAACGLPAIATMGSNLPEWLIDALAFKGVVIASDADAPGDTAAELWRVELRRRGAIGLQRLRPEGAKDWNELLSRDPAALRRQVLPYLPAVEFDPQCEELFLATVETVTGILCGAAANLPADVLNAQIAARCASGAPDEWPELVPLEVEMNEALAVGDLSRLRRACDVYCEAAIGANRSR